MEHISKYSHVQNFFSCVHHRVGSNKNNLKPKAGKVGQKSSLDWEIVQKEVPVPYQNSFQVAEAHKPWLHGCSDGERVRAVVCCT